MVKKPDKAEKPNELSQLDKFKETAKQVETDDSEEGFDAKLKKVAVKPAAGPQRPKS